MQQSVTSADQSVMPATMGLNRSSIKDLSINAIQEHENSKKYAKHVKAIGEARPTLALEGMSEEVDQNRRIAEKRREQAAYFSEKERIAAITKDNTKLLQRIAQAQASIDSSPTRPMLTTMQRNSSVENLDKSQRAGGGKAKSFKPLKLDSLNNVERAREQNRIEQQNVVDMKWLNAVKPSYDVRKQLKEFKYKNKIKQSIQRPMKQYLMNRANFVESTGETIGYPTNNDSSTLNSNRPESELLLPSLRNKQKQISNNTDKESLFKARSVSTQGIHKKYHAKMHIKLRKGSVEVHNLGLGDNRQAGTGSVDEIPSIQIIEPRDRIEEMLGEHNPTSSRSPKMQHSSSKKMLPLGRKKRAAEEARLGTLRHIYGTVSEGGLPSIESGQGGGSTVKPYGKKAGSLRKLHNKTVDSEVTRVLNAQESRVSVLNDKNSELRDSRHYSQRGGSNSGRVVVEATGQKWASVRVDSQPKFQSPYKPMMNQYMSESSDANANGQIVIGDIPIELLNMDHMRTAQEGPSNLAKGMKLEIVEPVTSQGDAATAEFLKVSKEIRKSPVNQSQPDVRRVKQKGGMGARKRSKSRISVDNTPKIRVQPKLSVLPAPAQFKNMKQKSVATIEPSTTTQERSFKMIKQSVPKQSAVQVRRETQPTPKSRKAFITDPKVAPVVVSNVRKQQKSPKAQKLIIDTPETPSQQEKNFANVLAQAKKPQGKSKKSKKTPRSNKSGSGMTQLLATVEQIEAEPQTPALAPIRIDLTQTDIAITKSKPVAVPQQESQSEQYTDVENSEEPDDVNQRASASEHLETVIQEPIETTQGNIVEDMKSPRVQAQAKILFSEEKKVVVIPVSEAEIAEHTPLINGQIEPTAESEQETPMLPQVSKTPFVAEEPDVFEPDSVTASIEPIVPTIAQDEKDAPATLQLAKKPFYAEEDSKDQVSEHATLTLTAEPTDSQTNLEMVAPEPCKVPKAPFFATDDQSPVEPTVIPAPSESATILQTSQTEVPAPGQVPAAPFYAADVVAPVEPVAVTTPNESMTVLQTATNDSEPPKSEAVIVKPPKKAVEVAAPVAVVVVAAPVAVVVAAEEEVKFEVEEVKGEASMPMQETISQTQEETKTVQKAAPIIKETTSVLETAPIKETKVEEASVKVVAVQEVPVQEAPAKEIQVEKAPVQEAPPQKALVQEVQALMTIDSPPKLPTESQGPTEMPPSHDNNESLTKKPLDINEPDSAAEESKYSEQFSELQTVAAAAALESNEPEIIVAAPAPKSKEPNVGQQSPVAAAVSQNADLSHLVSEASEQATKPEAEVQVNTEEQLRLVQHQIEVDKQRLNELKYEMQYGEVADEVGNNKLDFVLESDREDDQQSPPPTRNKGKEEVDDNKPLTFSLEGSALNDNAEPENEQPIEQVVQQQILVITDEQAETLTKPKEQAETPTKEVDQAETTPAIAEKQAETPTKVVEQVENLQEKTVIKAVQKEAHASASVDNQSNQQEQSVPQPKPEEAEPQPEPESVPTPAQVAEQQPEQPQMVVQDEQQLESERISLQDLDDKSVKIMTMLMIHFIQNDLNSSEFFQEVAFDQTMKDENDELFTVTLMKTPDFFRVLQEKKIRKKATVHENLREFLQLDADFPEFLLLKNVKKGLNQMSENEGFMAAVREDIGDDQVNARLTEHSQAQATVASEANPEKPQQTQDESQKQDTEQDTTVIVPTEEEPVAKKPVICLQAIEEHKQEVVDETTQLPAEVSMFDRSVFAVTNRLRSDPSSFIPLLQERLTYFDGDVLRLPGKQPIRSNEGPAAVTAAIEFLKQAQPVQKLSWSAEMALAARDHTQDHGSKGLTGHDGSDGSTTSDRLERYGQWAGGNAENVSYGKYFGINVVMQLLVDDGVPNRGHRRNLFDEDFTVTGSFSGEHTTQIKMTCIEYADSYITLDQVKKLKLAVIAEAVTPVELEDQMDLFLQEEVVFQDMPPNCQGYSQSMKVDVVGRKATKIVTRTCKLMDDTLVVITATESRTFAKMPGIVSDSEDTPDIISDSIEQSEENKQPAPVVQVQQQEQEETTILLDQQFDLVLPQLIADFLVEAVSLPDSTSLTFPEPDTDFNNCPERATEEPPSMPMPFMTGPKLLKVPNDILKMAANFSFAREMNGEVIDAPPKFLILYSNQVNRMAKRRLSIRAKRNAKTIHLTMPTISELTDLEKQAEQRQKTSKSEPVAHDPQREEEKKQ